MTTTLTASGITFNDTTSQTTTGVEIPTGTVMLFVQSTAPTGWTKSTAHNDKALRVVSGSVSSGGSVAFSTAMANRTLSIGSTTLSIAQMPSHDHTGNAVGQVDYITSATGYRNSLWATYNGVQGYNNNIGYIISGTARVALQGGGQSHTHSGSLDMAVQYVDVIICTKN